MEAFVEDGCTFGLEMMRRSPLGRHQIGNFVASAVLRTKEIVFCPAARRLDSLICHIKQVDEDKHEGFWKSFYSYAKHSINALESLSLSYVFIFVIEAAERFKSFLASRGINVYNVCDNALASLHYLSKGLRRLPFGKYYGNAEDWIGCSYDYYFRDVIEHVVSNIQTHFGILLTVIENRKTEQMLRDENKKNENVQKNEAKITEIETEKKENVEPKKEEKKVENKKEEKVENKKEEKVENKKEEKVE
eukprot:Trichotokara_eunicae@DN5885_c0_g1_i5.p1